MVVYLAHRLGSGPDRERNRENAARWARWAAYTQGVSPICSWIVLATEEETTEARTRGLEVDLSLVARCDELWLVGGTISPGMRMEMMEALRLGIPVVDMTARGYEAPRD